MPTVTTNYQTFSSSSNLILSYQCSHCGSRIIKRITIENSEKGRAGGLFGADPNELKENAEKATRTWEKRLLRYLEAPTKAGYVDAVKDNPVTGFDTPCPICGAKEPWQDEAQADNAQNASPITVSRNLSFSFEEARAALKESLTNSENTAKKYTGKAILAEKDTTIGLALGEEGMQVEGGEEISLNPFKKIKAISPSPFEKENTEAVANIIKSLTPMMEEL